MIELPVIPGNEPKIAIRPERYNILTAPDNPIYVGILASDTTNVEIYTSDDLTTPKYTGTVNPGYNPITVLSTNPFSIPPGQDGSMNYLLVKHGDESYKMNMFYVRTDTTDPVVYFKDENGNRLYGNVNFACLRYGLIQQYYGDMFIHHVTKQKLQNLGLDPSSCFLEFISYANGGKYYIVLSINELEQKIGTNSSIDFILSPVPDGRAIIVIEYNLTVLADLIKKKINYVGDYLGKALDFILNYGSSGIEFILNYQNNVARMISKFLGINYPIIKVEVEGGIMRVYYSQDIAPMTIAAAIAISALGIGVGWFIASGGIERVTSIIASSITTAVTSYTITKVTEERAKLYQDASDYCRSNTATPDQYVECVNSITSTIDTALTDTSIDAAIQLNKEYLNLNTKLNSVQSKTLLYGIGGVTLGLLLSRR